MDVAHLVDHQQGAGDYADGNAELREHQNLPHGKAGFGEVGIVRGGPIGPGRFICSTYFLSNVASASSSRWNCCPLRR